MFTEEARPYALNANWQIAKKSSEYRSRSYWSIGKFNKTENSITGQRMDKRK